VSISEAQNVTDHSSSTSTLRYIQTILLWTDASEAGFGAILEQGGEDQLRHPIGYASRQTNDEEKKYGPTQLEVAALTFGVEHFEVYLLGNKVTIFTDHQALVSAFLTHLKSQAKGLLMLCRDPQLIMKWLMCV